MSQERYHLKGRKFRISNFLLLGDGVIWIDPYEAKNVTRCVNYSKEKSLNFLHLYSMKTQHAIHDFFALFFHFYFVWYWYSISSFFIGWRRKMHLFYHFLTNKKNQSLRCSLLYCFFMSEDHFERRVYRIFLNTYLVFIYLFYFW